MSLFGHTDSGFVNEACLIKYDKYKLSWRQNSSGLYVPHILIDDVWIPIVNLHIHCKRLNNFMSKKPNEIRLSPLISLDDPYDHTIITGEKIQMLCDHYIGNSGAVINPKIETSKFLRNIGQPFDNKKTVFCYTHSLDSVVNLLKQFKNPFTLFCGNSDGAFEEKHLKILDDIPNLIKVVSQNIKITHPKLFVLPIGIANTQWGHGNKACWNSILQENNQHKSKDFYLNFKVNTNSIQRNKCLESAKKNGISWSNNTNYMNYLKLLNEHKFALCPEGNGIDTHRFWECVYLKVVPIVTHNTMIGELSKTIPMVIIDDWDNFDTSKVPNYSTFDWSHVDLYSFSTYKRTHF